MKRCKNLSKSLNGNLRCKLLKQQITLLNCKNCSRFIVATTKPIKKVSTKRIFVKDTVYDEVYERDKGRCRICGRTNIQIHHIIYRSEAKNLINDSSNCIMLCFECHQMVHSDKHYWQPILLNMNKEYMK